MKLQARGGMWQVHFTGADGNRVRTSTKVKVNPNLPDKGEAAAKFAALDIMRESLMQGASPEVRKEQGKKVRMNLAYALQRTLDERWSDQKAVREKRYQVAQLIREVGYWPLSEVTYTKLVEYGTERAKEGDSPATRNRKMSSIRTAMEEAFLRGEIPALPKFPHYSENNIKERYLSAEEEKTLLTSMDRSVAPDDDLGQYMKAVVPFLLDTGLRASEVLLNPDQDRGNHVWLKHGATKSNRGRTVPLTPRARAALTAMLASPVHTDLLTAYRRDKTIPSQRLGRRFAQMVKKAGIDGVTLHTLRHTCASRLVQAEVSLYTVRDWLGHSTVTITERYAHLAPKNLEQAAAALAQANSGVPSKSNVIQLPARIADTHYVMEGTVS